MFTHHHIINFDIDKIIVFVRYQNNSTIIRYFITNCLRTVKTREKELKICNQ